jgi:hypothetical protein
MNVSHEPRLRPPTVHDLPSWHAAVMEHRRSLFERVVAAYPHLMKTRRSDVETWRVRLSGPMLNVP